MGHSELASAELWEQGIDVEGEGHCRTGKFGHFSALALYATHELESCTMYPCTAYILDHPLHL